jgi:hypothetical protein
VSEKKRAKNFVLKNICCLQQIKKQAKTKRAEQEQAKPTTTNHRKAQHQQKQSGRPTQAEQENQPQRPTEPPEELIRP